MVPEWPLRPPHRPSLDGALPPGASPLPAIAFSRDCLLGAACSPTHLCVTWERPAGPCPTSRKGPAGETGPQPQVLPTSISLSFALCLQEALHSFKGWGWREDSASLGPPSGLSLSLRFSKMGCPPEAPLLRVGKISVRNSLAAGLGSLTRKPEPGGLRPGQERGRGLRLLHLLPSSR